MARAGDTIENPVSGERITWRRTTAETNGALLQWEHALRPGARVPNDHVHLRQEERFEVIAGTARVRVGNEVRELSAGESVVIPGGTPHGLYNETSEEVRVQAELRPAMNTELFFETSYGLARDGKVDRRGVPGILHLAVILRDLGEEHYMPGMPIALQRAALVALAPLGRLLSYRARYPEYSGQE